MKYDTAPISWYIGHRSYADLGIELWVARFAFISLSNARYSWVFQCVIVIKHKIWRSFVIRSSWNLKRSRKTHGSWLFEGRKELCSLLAVWMPKLDWSNVFLPQAIRLDEWISRNQVSCKLCWHSVHHFWTPERMHVRKKLTQQQSYRKI